MGRIPWVRAAGVRFGGRMGQKFSREVGSQQKIEGSINRNFLQKNLCVLQKRLFFAKNPSGWKPKLFRSNPEIFPFGFAVTVPLRSWSSACSCPVFFYRPETLPDYISQDAPGPEFPIMHRAKGRAQFFVRVSFSDQLCKGTLLKPKWISLFKKFVGADTVPHDCVSFTLLLME